MLLMAYQQQSKAKDVNVDLFNMITKIIEAKVLVKHFSSNCKWKFDSATCNSNQKWNNDKRQCECKKYHACKKDCSWNPSTCICESSRYLKVLLIIQ